MYNILWRFRDPIPAFIGGFILTFAAGRFLVGLFLVGFSYTGAFIIAYIGGLIGGSICSLIFYVYRRIMMKTGKNISDHSKLCFHCGEEIFADAKKCRYCRLPTNKPF